MGLVSQYDYSCMRTFGDFNYAIESLVCECIKIIITNLCLRYSAGSSLGHVGLIILCRNSPSPGIFELKVKII